MYNVHLINLSTHTPMIAKIHLNREIFSLQVEPPTQIKNQKSVYSTLYISFGREY